MQKKKFYTILGIMVITLSSFGLVYATVWTPDEMAAYMYNIGRHKIYQTNYILYQKISPQLDSMESDIADIKEALTINVMESIYSSWTGSLSGWSTIVTLTTPSLPTGYYKVELDAHAYLEYPSRLGIGIGVDSTSSDATTLRYWQCDSSPFESGSTFLTDVHTQEVFLLAEGTHTFYFRAGETSGGGGYCGLQNSHITVTFFPYS
jgi:hypothetical protein